MTETANSKGTILLVIGDRVVYIFSLILALTIRYGRIPSEGLLLDHLPSFSILFVCFFLVSFSAGLYDKQAAFIRKQIQGLLIRVQIINIVIGVIFFYLAPVVITPKVNLAIYFVVSTIFLFVWRMVMFPVLSISKTQSAILVGSGGDIDDLYSEVNKNDHYGLVFKDRIVPNGDVSEVAAAIGMTINDDNASVIAVDLHDKLLEGTIPFLYSMVFSGVTIVDAGKLYESIFDRIPISMVGERWLVENSGASFGNRRIYDIAKRLIDVLVASVGGIFSLIVYPFIFAAIKIEDHGDIFISQERVGLHGKRIKI